jgi:phage terminase large subunit GpA-like protein
VILLTWKFEWAIKRATAVVAKGTYVVECDGYHRWHGRFTRVGDSHAPVTTVMRNPENTAEFADLADAIHACQHHADDLTPDSSGRLLIPTPRP